MLLSAAASDNNTPSALAFLPSLAGAHPYHEFLVFIEERLSSHSLSTSPSVISDLLWVTFLLNFVLVFPFLDLFSLTVMGFIVWVFFLPNRILDRLPPASFRRTGDSPHPLVPIGKDFLLLKYILFIRICRIFVLSIVFTANVIFVLSKYILLVYLYVPFSAHFIFHPCLLICSIIKCDYAPLLTSVTRFPFFVYYWFRFSLLISLLWITSSWLPLLIIVLTFLFVLSIHVNLVQVNSIHLQSLIGKLLSTHHVGFCSFSFTVAILYYHSPIEFLLLFQIFKLLVCYCLFFRMSIYSIWMFRLCLILSLLILSFVGAWHIVPPCEPCDSSRWLSFEGCRLPFSSRNDSSSASFLFFIFSRVCSYYFIPILFSCLICIISLPPIIPSVCIFTLFLMSFSKFHSLLLCSYIMSYFFCFLASSILF